MSTLSAILIIIVIILLAAVVWLTIAWRRSQRLRSKFGPEYPRAVSEFGDRQRAERELERREKRVQNLEIRPLAPATRDRFVKAWHDDQERFVDDPKGALMEAERLVQAVMRERGYPVADFDGWETSRWIIRNWCRTIGRRARWCYGSSTDRPAQKTCGAPWCITAHCSTSCSKCRKSDKHAAGVTGVTSRTVFVPRRTDSFARRCHTGQKRLIL